jgi:hypothetical protein
MKEQIENILIKVDEGTMPVQQALSELLLLFSVSGSLPSIDPLDDENSEIHKIGREIAEMSDEEFDNNCKAITDMLSRSKGNDR